MNEGQNKFFDFIMERVKDECKEMAKKLLEESFERQNNGNFDLLFLTKFNTKIKDYIKEDQLDEVLAILAKFGKQHLS